MFSVRGGMLIGPVVGGQISVRSKVVHFHSSNPQPRKSFIPLSKTTTTTILNSDVEGGGE